MLTAFESSHFQGEPSDESSDEAPLLFSPLTSPSCQENCQELDMMDHCHVNEPKREKNKKVGGDSALASLDFTKIGFHQEN